MQPIEIDSAWTSGRILTELRKMDAARDRSDRRASSSLASASSEEKQSDLRIDQDIEQAEDDEHRAALHARLEELRAQP